MAVAWRRTLGWKKQGFKVSQVARFQSLETLKRETLKLTLNPVEAGNAGEGARATRYLTTE
jgi:hypothetical protein